MLHYCCILISEGACGVRFLTPPPVWASAVFLFLLVEIKFYSCQKIKKIDSLKNWNTSVKSENTSLKSEKTHSKKKKMRSYALLRS